MPTDMDGMQAMMAQMHARNYMNDMRLAQYFQSIGAVYTSKAQDEYRMYLFHSGQMPGMGQPQGAGQMPGMVPSQGAGQVPVVGQPQGAGQMPGMGQPQGAGQVPVVGQPIGPQGPGLGQPIGAGLGPGL